MRYYWEALFSAEYFPYWEFTMLMILFLNLSVLWRINRVQDEINELNRICNWIMDEVEE
tara:strand:+ start:490 stop:666 length:177 start_codon:yes stop_codon:yes gene_type:complete